MPTKHKIVHHDNRNTNEWYKMHNIHSSTQATAILWISSEHNLRVNKK